MEKIVPLISSSVAGPLGARHLPRLWLKILLHAAGRLPEGYRHGEGGFDETTMQNLGIEPKPFIEYVERSKPSYLELEAWVRAHAARLDAASIAAHNAYVVAREKPDAAAEAMRRDLGIDDPSLKNAVALNDLDDWALAHATITAAERSTV